MRTYVAQVLHFLKRKQRVYEELGRPVGVLEALVASPDRV
jgi:hypothetical protein